MPLFSIAPRNAAVIVLPPPSPYILGQNPGNDLSLEDLILPHILFWDPVHQYSAYFQGGLLCETCKRNMKKAYWKCGQSEGKQPRLLHDAEHTILLVIAVYSCDNGHTISSTDPSILRKVNPELQPFVLLHRIGFTKAFVRSVIQMISEGMTVSAIERYFKKIRADYGATMLIKAKLELVKSVGDMMNLQSSPLNLLMNPTPSDNIMLCSEFY